MGQRSARASACACACLPIHEALRSERPPAGCWRAAAADTAPPLPREGEKSLRKAQAAVKELERKHKAQGKEASAAGGLCAAGQRGGGRGPRAGLGAVK